MPGSESGVQASFPAGWAWDLSETTVPHRKTPILHGKERSATAEWPFGGMQVGGFSGMERVSSKEVSMYSTTLAWLSLLDDDLAGRHARCNGLFHVPTLILHSA